MIDFRRTLSAGLVLLSCACAGRTPERAAPPVPVVVATAARKDMPVRVEAIGAVEAVETVAIKPQVGGVITEVHFREGMDVGQGDVLFVIDPRPYEAALHQAESNLSRDEANAGNAEAEEARGNELFSQGILSKEQHDQLRYSAQGMKAAAQADRAAVEQARLELEYCTIKSPITGRTGSLLVHQGNLVKAIDGGPLVVINRIDPARVTFAIPQQRLAEVKRAREAHVLSVEALIPGEETHPLHGELTFVDNAVDAGTGTLRLKGTFPNAERRLWPGLFVKVRLTLATTTGAVVVPSQAIQEGQAGTFVFVVRKDLTAEARPVAADGEIDGQTVVSRGLEAGETVIIDGQLRVVPGAKVDAKQPPAAGAGGVSS